MNYFFLRKHNKRPLTCAHLALVRRHRVTVSVQVLDDAGDAERPGEAQQVSQVAEGAAEQDGTAERSIHGAPDGRGSIRILSCLRGERERECERGEGSQRSASNQTRVSLCSPSDPRRRL